MCSAAGNGTNAVSLLINLFEDFLERLWRSALCTSNESPVLEIRRTYLDCSDKTQGLLRRLQLMILKCGFYTS